MKKYYIPTSSLNFNNILSSESISPKAFYSVRSFGYGRWTSIPENPFENTIVLYDELCSFSRPQSDYEDHPLLIEIALEETVESTLISLNDHIFLCDHTIYIDLYSSRLIFFTENDKRIALSLSDSSLETKFVSLYNNKKIVVVIPPATSYTPIEQLERQPLNKVEIEKDKRINRMKGLLYGYYIGAILSASKEDVLRLNKAREIHNILAAIHSSLDHKATPQQRESLISLYAAFQPPVPLISKLLELIPEKSLLKAVVSVIRDEYGYIPGEFNVDRIISQLLISPVVSNAKNAIIEDINSTIKQIEETISKSAQPISVNDEQVVICNGILKKLNIDSLSDNDKKLCMAWINEVLVKDEYTGKISTFKEALSDDITRKAKEVCEAEWKVEWKGSYPEVTLNALRRHVRGCEYSHSWNNDIYSSISALVMRGDNWQKLLMYMQDKEMTDYRLTYAMYGTINGFANLTRDFTDVLLRKESRYIAEVYREFYGQLFGRDVVIPPKSELREETNNENQAVTSYQYLSDNRVKTDDYLFIIERAKITIYSKLKDSLNGEYIDIQDIEKALTKCTKRQLSQCDKAKEIFNLMVEKPIDQDRLKKYIVGKKKLLEVSERLGISITPANKPKRNKTKKKKQEDFSGTFDFSEIIPKSESIKPASIIDDDNACNIINGCVSLGNETKHITEMFIEFQKKYRPGGYYYEHSDQYRRNNSDVIDHFCKWCLSSKNSNAVQNNQANSRIFDELKRYLLKWYHD